MNNPSDNCDRKPLIALWYLHQTTILLDAATGGDALGHLLRLQRHWLHLCRKYGVTVDQVADSLNITEAHAGELYATAQEWVA